MVGLALKRTINSGTRTVMDLARPRKIGKMLVVFAVTLAASTCMYGTALLPGSAAFAGGAIVGVGGTTLATAFIDFFSTLPNCNVAGVGTPGCFNVQTGTGSFVTGSTATIQDLTAANTGGHVSGAINIPSFEVFSNGVIMDLTAVLPGTGVDCATLSLAALTTAGTTCTPHVGAETGPFTLQNGNGNTVTIGFTVLGNGYTGTAASGTSPLTKAFSTQFTNSNIATLLGTLNAGGTITNSYSVTETTAIPEPGTAYFFCGAALLFAPMLLRRRSLRNK